MSRPAKVIAVGVCLAVGVYDIALATNVVEYRIDWTLVLVAVITAIPALVAAFASIRNHRRITEVKRSTEQVVVAVNGGINELVAAREAIARAAGILEGVAQERARRGPA